MYYFRLKFFKTGEKKGIKFSGTRDLPTLSSFINEQLGGDEVPTIFPLSTIAVIPSQISGISAIAITYKIK